MPSMLHVMLQHVSTLPNTIACTIARSVVPRNEDQFLWLAPWLTGLQFGKPPHLQSISLQEHCAVSNILWTFWRMLFHHGTYPLILCTCSPWSMCWNFMAFLYLNLLYLPDPQPRVLVVTCRRSYESVQEVGKNIAIVWRPDSSVLAVTVSFSALVYTLYTVL